MTGPMLSDWYPRPTRLTPDVAIRKRSYTPSTRRWVVGDSTMGELSEHTLLGYGSTFKGDAVRLSSPPSLSVKIWIDGVCGMLKVSRLADGDSAMKRLLSMTALSGNGGDGLDTYGNTAINQTERICEETEGG